jgi:hypothetical protein
LQQFHLVVASRLTIGAWIDKKHRNTELLSDAMMRFDQTGLSLP